MKCDWAQEFSIDTWNRIWMSRRNNGFKIYETTITQNMIYSLLIKKIEGITIYESSDEKTNGNDLEVFIETANNKYVRYAVQSKIVYKNGKFEAIRHYNKHTDSYQIVNLMSYARSNRSIPLYFFYTFDTKYKGNTKNKIGIPYHHYGVAVSSAHRIYFDNYDLLKSKWRHTPTAKEILTCKNILSFPQFICDKMSLSFFRSLVFEPMAYAGNIKKGTDYTCNKNEIINNPSWIKVNGLEKMETLKKDNGNDREFYFNPKYRVVFNNGN